MFCDRRDLYMGIAATTQEAAFIGNAVPGCTFADMEMKILSGVVSTPAHVVTYGTQTSEEA